MRGMKSKKERLKEIIHEQSPTSGNVSGNTNG